MEIVSAKYFRDRITNTVVSILATDQDGQVLGVPLDLENRHYEEIITRHNDPDDDFSIQDAD